MHRKKLKMRGVLWYSQKLMEMRMKVIISLALMDKHIVLSNGGEVVLDREEGEW
jgi:hypothetical protein